jgi:hypothetical protein
MIVTAARRTIPTARRAVTTACSTSNLAGIEGFVLLKGCELQICIDRRFATEKSPLDTAPLGSLLRDSHVVSLSP